MAASSENILTRKIRGLPAWGWIAAAVVVFYLYRRFASGGTSAATSAGNSLGTGSGNVTPVDTGGGTAASGQGSAADNLTADLLSQLIGQEGAINSNLTTGLLGAVSSVEGLGYGALGLAGQSNQQLVDLTTTLWKPPQYVPTGGGSAGGSTTGGTQAPAPTPVYTPAYTPVVAHGTGAFSATNIASGGGPVFSSSPVDLSGHAVSSAGTRVGGALAA